MKKIIYLITVLLLTITFIGCNGRSTTYTYDEVLSSIQISYQGEDHIDWVTQDIGLPTSSLLDNKATLLWESSDEDIITSQGVVARPLYDTHVTLTLHLQVGAIARQEIYVLTVIGTTIYHTVIFDVDGSFEAVSVQSGYPVAEPTVAPFKEYLTFAGWFLEDSIYDFNSPVTSNLTLTAIFTSVSAVQYVIEIYEQRIENDLYQRRSNVILLGLPGENVTYSETNEGFHINESLSISSGLLSLNETLVLKIYYDRNMYETTYKLDNQEIGQSLTKHGATLSLIASPEVSGFTFMGWFWDELFSRPYDIDDVVTSDFVLYAKYEELTEGPYTLNIYYENITDDDFTMVSTTTLFLPIGTDVSYVESLEGFEINEVLSYIEGTIESYEGITLNVYYNRIRYSTVFVDNDIIFETTTKYQDLALQIEDLVKEDYLFLGWTRTFNGTNLYDFSVPVTSDLVLYAVWQSLNTPVYEGYYASLSGLPDYLIKNEITNIITPMNDRGYSFAITILQQSDVDPHNANNIILVYDRFSRPKTWSSGEKGTWNREHVWPQSKLGTASASDVHNLKPADPDTNEYRGNSPFGDDGIRTTHGYVQGGSFYFPGDQDKGDIARIILYMDIRWGLDITTNGIGSLNTFLQWHIEDPVDDFERNRNNVIYSHQLNRNPFIDHPELVERIWGTITTSTNENVSVSFYEAVVTIEITMIYDVPTHFRKEEELLA